jgi:hypothetical protein
MAIHGVFRMSKLDGDVGYGVVKVHTGECIQYTEQLCYTVIKAMVLLGY